jgi:alpha-L-glutamate ligase-like protein
MFKFLQTYRQLSTLQILGMNSRNVEYINRYNRRSVFPLVDDKLQTKQLAIKHGVSVPKLYGVISAYHETNKLESILEGIDDFALKPSSGSGGEGIIIIESRQRGRFVKPSGSLLTQSEMVDHVGRILGGIYSLGGQPDVAILEYRVRFDPIFNAVSYLGVPDIRIIVFRGVPAMAMVRLPTRSSDGKANLHQGAVGAGIDIGSGETIYGVWRNQPVEEHPDTANRIAGIAIPLWRELLLIAARCYEMTTLGILGVDIVLDRFLGPLLLELNARPGLSIQIANRAGLRGRFEKISSYLDGEKHDNSYEERVDFAMNSFSHLVKS